ncbi:FAD-dependent pyridine nucleotide-disulfide oxidoreductase [Caballeronia pedi]|uniref:FAD-dependent pyridine nucleotide-disulfide oxidoreductase n=1 Tax=Caballeronia pedi TaxID=1777141 RepID=A0A158CUH6_9BURK|nr:FAD-dependent oxidoreductase [Caballeronia pedi]SAK86032.1 FAD-dependent pyridine nucleotide-disulfide oxidoreductase [Caballeronia pedi]
MTGRTVIVGAGQAGARTAAALRRLDQAREITLLGDEQALPYERPPLSKDVLNGGTPAKTTIFPLGWYEEQRIALRAGVRVVGVDWRAKQVLLAHGESLAYDDLVLATGVRARPLVVPGANLDGVVTLRTIEDSLSLSGRLTGGANVVVIGGGFLGLEVAATAIARKCAVTVLEYGNDLLPRIFGGFLGRYLSDLHRMHGVEVRTGVQVTGLEGDTVVEAVRLADGTAVEADVVVVAIGATANDELARAAGADCDDGVLVDAHARTSLPSIFAVGDVARQRTHWLGESVRVESWENAEVQAQAAASAIAGAAPVAAAAPWFWTDQYDRNIQMLGNRVADDIVVIRGDVTAPSWSAFFVADNTIRGAVLINAGRERRNVKRLIETRQRIDCAEIADAGRPLFSQPRAQT